MVESAPLLREYTLIAYRGFESLSPPAPYRCLLINDLRVLFWGLTHQKHTHIYRYLPLFSFFKCVIDALFEWFNGEFRSNPGIKIIQKVIDLEIYFSMSPAALLSAPSPIAPAVSESPEKPNRYLISNRPSVRALTGHHHLRLAHCQHRSDSLRSPLPRS